MWMRFKMASTSPPVIPGIVIPADSLEALRSRSFIAHPGLLWMQWTPDPAASDLILGFLYETWSHRAKPTISKFRYKSKSLSGDGFVSITAQIIAPIYHLRLDQISFQTGDLISRHIFRVVNPGW
jgi:hypothetical protein